jgi:hypothetical protein
MTKIRVGKEREIEEYLLTLLPGYSMLFPIFVPIGTIPLEPFNMTGYSHVL